MVFLLFAIGLELSLERLQGMAKYVFGLGSAQVSRNNGDVFGREGGGGEVAWTGQFYVQGMAKHLFGLGSG